MLHLMIPLRPRLPVSIVFEGFKPQAIPHNRVSVGCEEGVNITRQSGIGRRLQLELSGTVMDLGQ